MPGLKLTKSKKHQLALEAAKTLAAGGDTTDLGALNAELRYAFGGYHGIATYLKELFLKAERETVRLGCLKAVLALAAHEADLHQKVFSDMLAVASDDELLSIRDQLLQSMETKRVRPEAVQALASLPVAEKVDNAST